MTALPEVAQPLLTSRELPEARQLFLHTLLSGKTLRMLIMFFRVNLLMLNV